jgi:hypothetical protein
MVDAGYEISFSLAVLVDFYSFPSVGNMKTFLRMSDVFFVFNTSGHIISHLSGIVDSGSFANIMVVLYSMHNENLGFH